MRYGVYITENDGEALEYEAHVLIIVTKEGQIFTEFKGDNRELSYLFMEMLRKLEVFKNEN